MKNAFDGLISRLDMAKERIFELEDYDGRNFPNWKAKRKMTGKTKQNRLFKTICSCGTTTKGVAYAQWEYQGRTEWNRRRIWGNNGSEFPQINVRYQTTGPERSEHQGG